jgi:hypothetical protein
MSCALELRDAAVDPAFWRAQAAALTLLAEKTDDTYLKGTLLRRADEYIVLAKKAEARLMLWH